MTGKVFFTGYIDLILLVVERNRLWMWCITIFWGEYPHQPGDKSEANHGDNLGSQYRHNPSLLLTVWFMSQNSFTPLTLVLKASTLGSQILSLTECTGGPALVDCWTDRRVGALAGRRLCVCLHFPAGRGFSFRSSQPRNHDIARIRQLFPDRPCRHQTVG